jgi:hypothetical protein
MRLDDLPAIRARRETHSRLKSGRNERRKTCEMNGGRVMAARETFAEREKRELDLQLDEELEGTFPASDPLKITRCSAKSRSVAEPVPKKNAAVPKNDT